MSLSRRGFTLIEVMVVIVIIAVLAAMLVPAVNVVRNSVRRTGAVAMIGNIHLALENYRAEDLRHRYPPPPAGLPYLRCDPAFVEVPDASRQDLRNSPGEVLDMLALRGLQWNMSMVDAQSLCLVDPWRRPYRYQVDNAIAPTPEPKPSPQADWNAATQPDGTVAQARPFAYLWSLGKPTLAVDGDADPAQGERWIYRRSDGKVR